MLNYSDYQKKINLNKSHDLIICLINIIFLLDVAERSSYHCVKEGQMEDSTSIIDQGDHIANNHHSNRKIKQAYVDKCVMLSNGIGNSTISFDKPT